MKINTNKMALSVGIAFALAWIACSVMVWLMPSQMMAMTGSMVHADFSMMAWKMSTSGFLTGLVGWFVASGITTWMAGFFYNRLL